MVCIGNFVSVTSDSSCGSSDDDLCARVTSKRSKSKIANLFWFVFVIVVKVTITGMTIDNKVYAFQTVGISKQICSSKRIPDIFQECGRKNRSSPSKVLITLLATNKSSNRVQNGGGGGGKSKTTNAKNSVSKRHNKSGKSAVQNLRNKSSKKSDSLSSSATSVKRQKQPDGTLMSNAGANPGSSLPQKKSVPPWQVLGAKDMKANIEREKERRLSIQKGELPSHAKLARDGDSSVSKNFLNPTVRKFLNWKRFRPATTIAGQRFVGAFLDPDQLPPSFGVPEVAFLGRSNVGKSSLLNRLTKMSSLTSPSTTVPTGSNYGQESNNKKERSLHQQSQTRRISFEGARVGKTPGATASVNLYTVLDKKGREILGWADLPGFGYAKLSKGTQESVQLAAENYLSRRKELALGILLVDIRRATDPQPNADDQNILEALYDLGIPIVVVATKLDKISSSTVREQSLALIRQGLNLPESSEGGPTLPLGVSSVTGEGIRELWQIILDGCEMAVTEANAKYEKQSNYDDSDVDCANVAKDDNDDEKPNVAYLDVTKHNQPSQTVSFAAFDEMDDYDNIEYDQGYDWVMNDGESVMLEDNEYDQINKLDSGFYEEYYAEDEHDDTNFINHSNHPLNVNYEQQSIGSLKSLKKRVKEMEKRGEI